MPLALALIQLLIGLQRFREVCHARALSREYERPDARARIRGTIVEKFHEADVSRKFQNVWDFPSAVVPAVRAKDESQGLVVSHNVKRAALEENVEVTECRLHRQQLPAETAAVRFGWLGFLRKGF